MRLQQRLSQFCQSRVRVRSNHQLIRICPAFVRDRDSLASPDQAGAALPESLPAPHGVFTGVAIGKAVPTFHGLHGDAVARFVSAAIERLLQRRVCPGDQLGIAGKMQANRMQMIFESLNIFYRAEAQDGNFGHNRPASVILKSSNPIFYGSVPALGLSRAKDLIQFL
jgi:hypothetical protein